MGSGDAIPSEAELAGRFNVSQGTVRKAIDEMAAEISGPSPGKGTFVATHDDPAVLYRFLRLMPTAAKASRRASRCPARSSMTDPGGCPWIRSRIGEGDPVVALERLLGSTANRWCSTRSIWWANSSGLTLSVLRGTIAPSTACSKAITGSHDPCRGTAAAVPADPTAAGCWGQGPLLLVERTAFHLRQQTGRVAPGFCCTKHHYLNELG